MTGGAEGGIRLYDKESNIIWDYTLNNDTIRQHHDVLGMPNGNILILGWNMHSLEEKSCRRWHPKEDIDGI
jgi:hypothetical protein